MEDAEVILAVGDPVVCGLAKPHASVRIIRLAVHTLSVKDAEIVHGPGIAGLCGCQVEPLCALAILLDPDAPFVDCAKTEFGLRQPLLGGTLKPLGSRR